MPILSLRDFVEQARKQREAEKREVRVVTVRDFLHAIESNYNDDWTAEVTCDYPELGSYLVKLKPPEDA
jgi:hypothetical protein